MTRLEQVRELARLSQAANRLRLRAKRLVSRGMLLRRTRRLLESGIVSMGWFSADLHVAVEEETEG